VQRDSAGRSQITTPTSPPDIANKGYVDSGDATVKAYIDAETTRATGYESTEASARISGDATVKAFFTGAGLNASSPSSSDASAASVGTIISIAGTHAECVAGNCPNIGLAPTTPMWWNIFTFGIPSRATQIASQAFNGQGDTVKLCVRRKHDDTWSSWEALPNSIEIATGSSYNLVGGSTPILFVNSTANPFTINLPQTATCPGYKVKIICMVWQSTGLVKIMPYTGDRIGVIPVNTAVYLQNTDQNGGEYLVQFIELVADQYGIWVVTGGQYMPEPGSADAPGSQYYLGKLRHLPLGNVSDRTIYSGVGPGSFAWLGSAIQATGVKGVPVGAKAVRVRITISSPSSTCGIAVSDNNSNAPSLTSPGTSHPAFSQTIIGSSSMNMTQELDAPVNAYGQFYAYGISGAAAGIMTISAIGYYMGD
jgi:hypothetical protein